MTEFKYVIVGAGPAGYAAARAIREVDAQGSIAVLGEEPHRPYARPPLSKALWLGKGEETVWYDSPGSGVFFGQAKVARLERGAHQVLDEQGHAYRYQKLLLATGGAPRTLGPPHERIVAFRTLDDFRRLKRLVGSAARVAVVGGGFIGSEIAAVLAQNGKRVTVVFPETHLCARAFDGELGGAVMKLFKEKGVELLPGELVAGVDASDAGVSVTTKSGKRVDAEVVVVGIGIVPNVALAKDAGLAVSDGIEVNASLQTSDPDVYAAGDVARFPSAVLGKSVRVEHEDAALSMGTVAGKAMAGERVAFTQVPFFYSDLFELGYEAVGEVDSRHTVVSDWKTPFKEGVLYYLSEGRVRGVLLLNVWGKVDEARALLAEPGPFTSESLKGRIAG